MTELVGCTLRGKRFTLYLLSAASVASLGLASIIGLQEVNLPNGVKFDELRLLEPQQYDNLPITLPFNGFETAETQLAAINKCVRTNLSSGNHVCLEILEGLLRENPGDGRLWLEMARIQSQEVGALQSQALIALERSYDFAPREGWIIRVRTRFVLSVWQGLTPALKEKATAEIIAALSDDTFVGYLGGIYLTNPVSIGALREIILKAPRETQHKFLSSIQHSTPN